jgi:hypothetical protein
MEVCACCRGDVSADVVVAGHIVITWQIELPAMLRVESSVWEREGHGILHPPFTVGEGVVMSTYRRTWPDEI